MGVDAAYAHGWHAACYGPFPAWGLRKISGSVPRLFRTQSREEVTSASILPGVPQMCYTHDALIEALATTPAATLRTSRYNGSLAMIGRRVSAKSATLTRTGHAWAATIAQIPKSIAGQQRELVSVSFVRGRTEVRDDTATTGRPLRQRSCQLLHPQLHAESSPKRPRYAPGMGGPEVAWSDSIRRSCALS